MRRDYPALRLPLVAGGRYITTSGRTAVIHRVNGITSDGHLLKGKSNQPERPCCWFTESGRASASRCYWDLVAMAE